MSLLQMSFMGAVMILAVTIIRALTLERLPKMTFLVLWGIVLCRLLLPVSIPSAYNVYACLGQISIFKSGYNAESFFRWPETIEHSFAAYQCPLPLWMILWAAGMAACATLFFVAYRKCRWEFRVSLPIENGYVKDWLQAHPLKRQLSIRQSDRFSTPLAYGVLHPVILMPSTTNWENTTELEYILTHEYVHIRRFDSVTKMLVIAALCIHWFNPLVWVMYFLVNRDLELSCDEAVLHVFGIEARAAYARVLIHMQEMRSDVVSLYHSFGKDVNEERIRSIMKTKKWTVGSLVAAFAFVAGMAILFAASSGENITTAHAAVYTVTTAEETTYYRSDCEQAWLSEEEYKQLYPEQEIVWWTYDSYKAYLEEIIPIWQSYADQGLSYKTESGEWTKWTQEKVDEIIAICEENLDAIQQGAKLSREVNGTQLFVRQSEPSVSYSAAIEDQNGKLIYQETFSTKDEQVKALQEYG